ncbi:hypothetical protein ACFQRB_04820 [Halobaculum litoreum]|uniref:LexA-binding, inner membrane-associated hydrolase n=1 Tax=Halobaculum litoreum TaxID=3031998 RepID=A0ABD5XQZ6_9EURY
MYSRHHAAVSAVVAAGLVWALPLGDRLAVAAGWWAVLTAAGVLIDLDHFVMARVVRGDWANARRALANPARPSSTSPSCSTPATCGRSSGSSATSSSCPSPCSRRGEPAASRGRASPRQRPRSRWRSSSTFTFSRT